MSDTRQKITRAEFDTMVQNDAAFRGEPALSKQELDERFLQFLCSMQAPITIAVMTGV